MKAWHALLRGLWSGLRTLLLALAALWFFFEEFGWRPLAAWLGRFTSWPPWARTEARIAALSPRFALLVFLLPAALLLPVKLLAVGLIHAGQPIAGVIVIVLAKLAGTAIGGRLFVLMRPQLMTIRRFARLMAWWRIVRRMARRWLAASVVWRAAHGLAERWRAHWRRS